MPHRFCAICGIDLKGDAPHFGMCLNCYLKENPLFKLPQNFNFKICLDCGNFSRKEEWFQSNSNDLFSIIEASISRFLLKPYMKNNSITFLLDYNEESFYYSSKDLLRSLEVKVKGFLTQDSKISFEQNVKINIDYDLCNNCTNLRGGTYFLSIIQLRVKSEDQFNLIEEVLEDIHRFVRKIFKKDNKQYITKIETQKNGVDLLLSTNELMNHIISHLKPNYNFISKRTKKLVGRDVQKGRNLYRFKTLIKFLPFKKNDIIIVKNEKYIVETITKNKIFLRSENESKIVKNYSYFFNDKIQFKRFMEGK